ncbi:MAG: hypothetical protein RSA65_10690, partial [Clostridia bacterium]
VEPPVVEPPVVEPPVEEAVMPTISFKLNGSTLKAVLYPESTTATYAWARDGAAIADATHASYTLTDTDWGHKFTVTVTMGETI